LRNILNNLKNTLTKKSLNKLIYKKIVRNVLLLIDFYKEDINYIAKKKEIKEKLRNL